MEGPFLVGPAVDEAAEAYEKANAAIVWVTPAAKAALDEKFKSNIAPILDHHGFYETEYLVPMKDNCTSLTYAINPMWRLAKTDRALWMSSLLETFSHRPDTGNGKLLPEDLTARGNSVETKRGNTETFLRACHESMFPREPR